MRETCHTFYLLMLYIIATTYLVSCPSTIILMVATYEEDQMLDKKVEGGGDTYITTMVANAFAIPFYFSQGWHYWSDANSQLLGRHYIRQLFTIFVNFIYVIVIMTANGILFGAGYFYPRTWLQANVIVGAYILYLQMLWMLVHTIYVTIKQNRMRKQLMFPFHPFYVEIGDELYNKNINILNDPLDRDHFIRANML